MFSSSLWQMFSVIRDKCVDYSVKAPTTGGGTFKLALCGLNTIAQQQNLFLGVGRLPNSIFPVRH